MQSRIEIGNYVGCRIAPDSAMHTVYHAVRTFEDGETERGYLLRRRWVEDVKSYEECPTLGWAIEHWFEWIVD